MGAVSIDVYKKEKEYRHLTLSDENVVKYLIEFRSQVDFSYGANANVNIHMAGDVMDFNVELIALYASLDSILARAKLKEKERVFLGLLFMGHTVGDIIKSKDHHYPHRTAYRIMKRVVDRVVEINKSDWLECMNRQGYIGKKEELQERVSTYETATEQDET